MSWTTKNEGKDADIFTVTSWLKVCVCKVTVKKLPLFTHCGVTCWWIGCQNALSLTLIRIRNETVMETSTGNGYEQYQISD